VCLCLVHVFCQLRAVKRTRAAAEFMLNSLLQTSILLNRIYDDISCCYVPPFGEGQSQRNEDAHSNLSVGYITRRLLLSSREEARKRE